MLVLEDLGTLAPGHRPAGATLEEAMALVAAVGGWHRQLRDRLDPSWPTKTLPPAEAHLERLTRAWLQLVARHPLCSDVVHAVTDLIRDFPSLCTQLQRSPAALHCDLHVHNVFFDGTRPIVVDWENAAVGPAAIDLAGALLCAAPEVLEDHWRTLVDAYRHATGGEHAVRGGLAFWTAYVIDWLVENLDVPEPKHAQGQRHWRRLQTALVQAARHR